MASLMEMVKKLEGVPEGINVEAEFKPLLRCIDVYVFDEERYISERFELKRISEDLKVERDCIYSLVDKIFFAGTQ